MKCDKARLLLIKHTLNQWNEDSVFIWFNHPTRVLNGDMASWLGDEPNSYSCDKYVESNRRNVNAYDLSTSGTKRLPKKRSYFRKFIGIVYGTIVSWASLCLFCKAIHSHSLAFQIHDCSIRNWISAFYGFHPHFDRLIPFRMECFFLHNFYLKPHFE